jgi:glycosyltransferase involved in cell wall biosynthesis
MARQFIIVNNGMTEMRGHYFETAVSIAEAARDVGFRPFLAVHHSCPIGAIPSWLDCLSHFRVDHWGGLASFEPLRRDGISGNRSAMLDALIGALSVSDYLDARYDPLPEPPPLKQRAKQFLKRWIPTAALNVLKGLMGATRNQPVAVEPEDPERHHEEACARLFEEDLEYLLCLNDIGPDDLVFMPTANHREVYAVRRLIAKIGERRVPRFHLEFRHEIAEHGNLANETRPAIIRETRFGRFFFDLCRQMPKSPGDRLSLWTDTEELAEDYLHLSGYPFGVLPIPFNHSLIKNRQQPGRPPLTCLYLGDVREEKGFHLLPVLIRSLQNDDSVRFVIQATKPHPAATTPTLLAAMSALSALESFDPNLVGLAGRDLDFLPREQYFRMLAESDIVLCLYDAKIYRARSSGIMTEALAAGKPVIVPAETWMAHQLPQGCGECFADRTSLVAAVQRIAVDYPHYHANVQRQRGQWLARHSPQTLLACLQSIELRVNRAA